MSQVPAMLDRLERETGPDGNWTIHRNEHRTDYLSVGDWLTTDRNLIGNHRKRRHAVSGKTRLSSFTGMTKVP
jgi:hypothetical protein